MKIDQYLAGTMFHSPYRTFRSSPAGRFLRQTRAVVKRMPAYLQHALLRWKDYLNAARDPELARLHRRLRSHLRNQKRKWPSMRYNHGYFYQGWDRIAITGARATEVRFEKYRMSEILEPGMRILDIGANAAFFSCAMAERVTHVDAVELNPYQLAAGRDVAEFLGIDNVSFINADFQEFSAKESYGLITSFANHHTTDGNMAPDLRAYFERLWGMLVENGTLLFESHTTDNVESEFHAFFETLSDLFIIQRKNFFTSEEIGGGGDRYFYVFIKASRK